MCLMAPDEWATAEGAAVAVKDLADGTQATVSLKGLGGWAQANVRPKE